MSVCTRVVTPLVYNVNRPDQSQNVRISQKQTDFSLIPRIFPSVFYKKKKKLHLDSTRRDDNTDTFCSAARSVPKRAGGAQQPPDRTVGTWESPACDSGAAESIRNLARIGA